MPSGSDARSIFPGSFRTLPSFLATLGGKPVPAGAPLRLRAPVRVGVPTLPPAAEPAGRGRRGRRLRVHRASGEVGGGGVLADRVAELAGRAGAVLHEPGGEIPAGPRVRRRADGEGEHGRLPIRDSRLADRGGEPSTTDAPGGRLDVGNGAGLVGGRNRETLSVCQPPRRRPIYGRGRCGLAEGEGFEPSRRYNRLRDFQSRALGQTMRPLHIKAASTMPGPA